MLVARLVVALAVHEPVVTVSQAPKTTARHHVVGGHLAWRHDLPPRMHDTIRRTCREVHGETPARRVGLKTDELDTRGPDASEVGKRSLEAAVPEERHNDIANRLLHRGSNRMLRHAGTSAQLVFGGTAEHRQATSLASLPATALSCHSGGRRQCKLLWTARLHQPVFSTALPIAGIRQNHLTRVALAGGDRIFWSDLPRSARSRPVSVTKRVTTGIC
jgi:hypothetical protein